MIRVEALSKGVSWKSTLWWKPRRLVVIEALSEDA